jgi:intracellular multiplication protein IcmD
MVKFLGFVENWVNVGGVKAVYSNMKTLRSDLFFKGAIIVLLMIAGMIFTTSAWAEDQGLGTIATNIQGSLQGFGKLMIAIAYLAGIAFVLASIFKFKQHKDNPTQIPLGTPLALLVIGIILVFLPSIFEPAGKTVFGTSGGTAGGFDAGGLTKIPGSGGGGGGGTP